MKSNLIAIMSAVPGNGAKYTAVNLAYRKVSEDDTARVLLVDFDFESPCLAKSFIQGTDRGFDTVMNYIQSGTLTDRFFEENTVQTEFGVFVLPGTRLSEYRHYSHEHVQTLLEVAQRNFDYVYVVIMPKSNHAAFFEVLRAMKELVLVVRNTYANDDALPSVIQQLRHGMMSSDELRVHVVYNMKNVNPALELNRHFANDDAFRVSGVFVFDETGVDNLNLWESESFLKRFVNRQAYIALNQKIWS